MARARVRMSIVSVLHTHAYKSLYVCTCVEAQVAILTAQRSEARHLLRECLSVRPSVRPSVHLSATLMSHP